MRVANTNTPSDQITNKIPRRKNIPDLKAHRAIFKISDFSQSEDGIDMEYLVFNEWYSHSLISHPKSKN